jgi:transposase
MDILFKHCAGLDIHKKIIVACILLSSPEGVQRQIRKFATTMAGLEALAAWLTGFGVTHVAMESTGVYWKPVFNVLASHFEVWIVNARDMKNVPGRKTDVCDAEWICKLMSIGLLKRSFIPEVAQRDLRDLTRYRRRLVEERTSASNRLEKILEDSNIKLSAVASKVQGVSVRLMIEALIAGETDTAKIADLAKARLRSKIPELQEALVGQIREHHRFMWRELLYHLDELNERLAAINARIAEYTAPHEDIIQRLDAIPGVNRWTAEVILAEIGPDVQAFPSEHHLASWACLCPGNNISANKRRSGKTRRGQNWLRPALVEAAWATAHTQTYFGSQFHRLRARRGDKRAAVAVAHSILIVVYHLLAKPEAVYTDLGADYFVQRDVEKEQRRAVRKLEALGYTVTLTPVPAQAATPEPVTVAAPNAAPGEASPATAQGGGRAQAQRSRSVQATPAGAASAETPDASTAPAADAQGPHPAAPSR